MHDMLTEEKLSTRDVSVMSEIDLYFLVQCGLFAYFYAQSRASGMNGLVGGFRGYTPRPPAAQELLYRI
jgi:hypothetical protein